MTVYSDTGCWYTMFYDIAYMCRLPEFQLGSAGMDHCCINHWWNSATGCHSTSSVQAHSNGRRTYMQNITPLSVVLCTMKILKC